MTTRTNIIARITAMDDGAKNQLILDIVDELYLEDGVMDEEKEFDVGTIERVCQAVHAAKLNPAENVLPSGEPSALVSS